MWGLEREYVYLLNCGVTVVKAVRKDKKLKSLKELVMQRPILKNELFKQERSF